MPIGVRIIRRALRQREALSFLTEVRHLGQHMTTSQPLRSRGANIIGVYSIMLRFRIKIERTRPQAGKQGAGKFAHSKVT